MSTIILSVSMHEPKQDTAERAVALYRRYKGMIETRVKTGIESMSDLSLVYTPGVGAVSKMIAEHPEQANELTWRGNAVAVISDGSAVLGLGNIGSAGALPVMEGKCAIFQRFASINAVPLVLGTQDVDEIVKTVIAIAPSFGAIQLEDISGPRCFEIERRLQEALNIPVMHDDQHGTAIVALAALNNALKVVGKSFDRVRIVLNGAGAAGIGIARLLVKRGVKELIAIDRQGAIYEGRDGLNEEKKLLASFTNPEKRSGSLADIAKGADVLIGVSSAGVFTKDIAQSLAQNSIIIAMANPVPEILPETAKEAGVAIMATGRSDFPNQVNNALCYPGLFRGMLDYGVKEVTDEIKFRAAEAIASMVPYPAPEKIIPNMFDPGLVERVALSVVE